MGDFDKPFGDITVYLGDQKVGTISDTNSKAIPDIAFEVDEENSRVRASFEAEIRLRMCSIYLSGHNSRSRMKCRAKRLMRGYHADKC